MKKKLSATLLLALCILTACSAPSEPNEMEQMLDKVEQGLGEDYEKQAVTRVYDFTYVNEQGNTLIMYLCITTYFAANPETNCQGLFNQIHKMSTKKSARNL